MKVPPPSPQRNGEPPGRSRRAVLAALGGASLIGLAGCADRQPRYRLSALSLGPSLARTFTWTPDGPFAAFDRDLASEIVARGSVATDGFRLSNTGPDNPSYVERDGTYYEIRVREAETVTRTRWLLWFDRVDTELPRFAEVYTSTLGVGDSTPLDMTYGLSELDVHAVAVAEGRMAPEYGFVELEDEPPERRGYLFLRRAPDTSALVPNPPFTHVAFESGGGAVYARAVVEQVTVSLTRFVHTATPIGESADAYRDSLHERYVAAAFDSDGLSAAQRSLLSAAWTGAGYEETVPLTDDFASVLERIGVADVAPPDPRLVAFSGDVYFKYDGTYYEAQLEIFG